MPKYKVKVQPSGLLNGKLWPEAGETVDLPDAVAEAMVKAGDLAEDKPAKKAAAKKDESEKRPAANADVETRKKS